MSEKVTTTVIYGGKVATLGTPEAEKLMEQFVGNAMGQPKEKETEEAPANVSGARLKLFIEKIEKLEEEKKAIAEDIRDVYSESKATGFEPKIIRKIVSLRKANLEKRREEAELLSLYQSAIGMAE